MAKLDLDFDTLDKIFEIDIPKKELRLKPDSKGNFPSSMNTQQFYNWYREIQGSVRFLSDPNMVDGGGFNGLQPIVVFKTGLKFVVPDVPKFTIHGTIATEYPGDYPFIVSSTTALVVSRYARPHANVFLSHSSKDKIFVREIREKLFAVCETFFDETDIFPGQSITSRLNDELNNTDMLALVYSNNAAESEWVKKEWASILHLGKSVVVIRLDDEPLPPLLADLKYIDGHSPIQSVADDLSAALGVL